MKKIKSRLFNAKMIFDFVRYFLRDNQLQRISLSLFVARILKVLFNSISCVFTLIK